MAKDLFLTGAALKKALAKASDGPVSFAYAFGKSIDEDLFTIDRKKAPGPLGKELSAAASGSKFATGKAQLENKVLTLSVEKDQPGLAKRMVKFLRTEKIMFDVQIAGAPPQDHTPVQQVTDTVSEADLEGVGHVKVSETGKISVGPGDPAAALDEHKKNLRVRAAGIRKGFKPLRKQQQAALMKALAEALKSVEKGDLDQAAARLAKIKAASLSLSADTRAQAEDAALAKAAEAIPSTEDTETVKLQVKNWNSFVAWIRAHGDRVAPIPEKGIVYAGFPQDDLNKWKAFLMREEQLRGVWFEIEKVNANIKQWSGRKTFDLLSHVIKRIGAPLPEVVYTHGNLMGRTKDNFQNLDHVVKNLTSREDKFLDRGRHNSVWGALSKLYASNAQGEIAIWEGRLKNGKQVDASRHLISEEIKAIMARDDIPEETRKTAEAIYKRHEHYYKQQEAMIQDVISSAPARIEAAAKA
ncbi:MAG: hypothetical protein AAF727_03985 [Pseudomonadota bacterium]